MIYLKCIKRFILFFCCFCNITGAQNINSENQIFGKYLSKNQLYFEEQTLLDQIISEDHLSGCIKDSLVLRKSNLSFLLKDYSNYAIHLNQVRWDCLKAIDEQKSFLAGIILTDSACKKGLWTSDQLGKDAVTFKNDFIVATYILGRSTMTDNFYLSHASKDFQLLWERYINVKKKSPAIAGLLSTIIPGLGKLYIGQAKPFITTLIPNILLALQAGEAFYLSGYNSIHFIATCSLFGIFYLGNIWGSIAGTKKQWHDMYHQLDYEIYSYYSSSLLGILR